MRPTLCELNTGFVLTSLNLPSFFRSASPTTGTAPAASTRVFHYSPCTTSASSLVVEATGHAVATVVGTEKVGTNGDGTSNLAGASKVKSEMEAGCGIQGDRRYIVIILFAP